MKKKKLAFTMIELIVVVSIISIISISSLNGFFGFLEENQIKMKLKEVKIYVDSLDKKIKNHEIYDYKIKFDINNKDIYIIYENIFDKSEYTSIEYNQSNNNANIIVSDLNGNAWILKIFKDIKLNSLNTLIVDNLNLNIEKGYNYRFESFLSGATNIKKINTAEILKIDKENNLLKLNKINTSLGGADIGDLEIVNVGGKKLFYNSGSLINDKEIFLHFESKGRENYLKITK